MLNLPKPHPLPHPYEHEEEKNSHQILDFWKTPSSYSKWNSCGRLVASLARPLPHKTKKKYQNEVYEKVICKSDVPNLTRAQPLKG